MPLREKIGWETGQAGRAIIPHLTPSRSEGEESGHRSPRGSTELPGSPPVKVTRVLVPPGTHVP